MRYWLTAALALCPAAMAHAQGPARGLADLSLEQLSNIVVSTVSRREEPLSRAPASIYVITADEIRRSGATSLPEALRLAPNLQVARVDSSQYAITARGFNSTTANKLLVLIDGRTVYTPCRPRRRCRATGGKHSPYRAAVPMHRSTAPTRGPAAPCPHGASRCESRRPCGN